MDSSGELASTIIAYQTSDSNVQNSWVVTSYSPIAAMVEEGTAPHIIEGNPLLIFFWENADRLFVGHSVNHPGMEGKHFMQKAFDKNKDLLVQNIELKIEKSKKELGL